MCSGNSLETELSGLDKRSNGMKGHNEGAQRKVAFYKSFLRKIKGNQCTFVDKVHEITFPLFSWLVLKVESDVICGHGPLP